ncbi:MAG: bacterial Ig-like domain-containing protein, partial [Lachnospiraceae bacterium]|nr:bacterial Ig-like domain-containing protein [Lachnospiraceae bacterium]
LTVYLQYTDYSTEEILDYRVVNPVISSVGSQKVQIVYNSMQTTVDVYGTQAKTVSMLTAVYEGEGAPQGYAVPEKNMYVTALYTDGTSERIYNYTMTPATVQNIGDNKMIVSFRGKSVEITVKGVELTAQSIEAVYKGSSVEVGDYVAAEDVTVTAFYSDGSKAVVKDFTFSSDRITMTGENTIIVNYGGQSATIKVTGIARSGASYSNAASFTVKNTQYSANVQVALPKRMQKDAIVGKSLKPDRVSRVINKVKAEVIDYIAFDILLTDELQDDVFPLTMRIDLPQKYKAKETNTYLYYTSNRKSVMARVALEPSSDGVIEVTLFHTGTYILVNEKEIVEDDLPDPEDDYL